MDTIIFTITKGNHALTIKTKSSLVDVEDAEFTTSKSTLFDAMTRLGIKYNERNIAVLFETE